jgi:hypothetical protein
VIRISIHPIVLILLAHVLVSPLPADESALTVADLAGYRAALSGKGKDKGKGAADRPVARVGFRDLWDHPARYEGRRVQVEGRVVRRFRQGSFGTFPPLEEAWLSSPRGDPFCIVFPEPETPGEPTSPGTTAQVQFVGTFLKLLKYEGGDGPRLAPLIVGPAPPLAAVASDRRSRPEQVPGFRLSRLDWMIGLGAAVVVAAVLARQHLRRPVRQPWSDELTPAPLFDDAIEPAPPTSKETRSL